MFSPPNTNPNVPAFIAKLWHMVSNPKSDHLISWNDDGTSFIIKNHARFSSELLPMYYKHNNMASFIRQLNKYGFHKVMTVDSSNDKDFEFAHPEFVKGCPAMLAQIKRKLSNTRESEFKGDSNLVTKLLQEVKQLQAKQELFETKLSVMKNENDALWREQAILRQRHQKQQKIVNKLIQFLVTLVQQTRGLNMKRRIPLMLKDGSPGECYMAIKDSGRSNSPLICEIDPTDMYGNVKAAPVTSKEVKDESSTLINALKETDTQLSGDKNFLEDSTIPTIRSNTDFAVPLQEISPAIVQTNHPVMFDPSSMPTSVTGSRQLNLNNGKLVRPKQNVVLPSKKPLKRKHSLTKCNKTDFVITPSDRTNDNKSKEDSQTEENPLLINTCSAPSNIEWDCSDVTGISVDDTPASILGETPASNVTITEHPPAGENLVNNDTSLVVSDLAPIMNKSKNFIVSSVNSLPFHAEKSMGYLTSELPLPKLKDDMDNHIDMVQSDLDLLKDILHGEGLSLDASTLMGLFNADDPLSLNLPEASRNPNEDELGSGNEVVAYSPNLIDMADILDDQNEEYTNISVPSPTEINTPIIEFDSPPSYLITSPSPSKRSTN